MNGAPAGFLMDLNIGTDPDTDEWVLSSSMTPLATLPGRESLIPLQVSDTGEIVGIAATPYAPSFGTYQASASAPFVVLPPSTTQDVVAYQRSALGQIIGTVDGVSTLWDPRAGGGFTASPLQSLVPSKPAWQMTYSFAINEQGCICSKGSKYDKGKYTHTGVLLVPNP